MSKLHDLSNALLDQETIDSEEFNSIIENGYNPSKDESTLEDNKGSSKRKRRTSDPDSTQDWIPWDIIRK